MPSRKLKERGRLARIFSKTMKPAGKCQALLATARVANLPSVISNVWVGIAATFHFSLGHFLVLTFAGCCLYTGGNFLNDWADRQWDKTYRPERALPQGLFSPESYFFAAISLLFSGWIAAFLIHWQAGCVAAAIIASIGIYTIFHKRTPWAVIPMGLCRALLPFLGAAGIWGFRSETSMILICSGLALFSYVAGLSLVARNESKKTPDSFPKWLGNFLLAAPLLLGLFLVVWFLVSNHLSFNLISRGFYCFLPFGFWLAHCQTIFSKPIGRHVSALLAGIPLVDMVFLSVLCSGSMTFAPVVSFLAFLGALLLQRISKAT